MVDQLIIKVKKYQETSERMSKALKGKNKGKIRTEEHRRKISETLKGQKAWNKGMTKEDEVIYRKTKGLL